MNKILLSFLLTGILSSAGAGDRVTAPFSKAPIGKAPIEECVDLGGELGLGYGSDYIYKGLLIGGDTVSSNIQYQFDGLAVPVTVAIQYVNVVSPNEFSNIYNDELTLTGRVGLPTVAGVESSLSYSQRFYPEDPNTPLWPSSHGEIGLHLARDFQVAVLKFNAFYNLNLPNAWNGTIPTLGTGDNGAWYWDISLERELDIFGQPLVIGGGVAFADNYWGSSPAAQTGGRTSGWNHYFLSAQLPIELNCRTVLTPYIGYSGAPEGWLMDGAPDWANRPSQSDLLHGGVNLIVSF